MNNILSRLNTKKDGEVEFIDVVSEEEAELLLPQMADDLDMEKQYRQIMFFYGRDSAGDGKTGDPE